MSLYYLEKQCEPLTIPTIYRLKVGPNSIGRRHANDIHIEAEECSRHHCVVTVKENNVVVVQDLQSTYGTYVNAMRISSSETYIKPNDLIGVGGPATLEETRNIFRLKMSEKPHDADVDTPFMTKKSLVTSDSTPTVQRKDIVQPMAASSSRQHKIPVQSIESGEKAVTFAKAPFDRADSARKPIRRKINVPQEGSHNPPMKTNEQNQPVTEPKSPEVIANVGPNNARPKNNLDTRADDTPISPSTTSPSVSPAPILSVTVLKRNIDEQWDGVSVAANDINTLQPGNWITDNIINYYFKYIHKTHRAIEFQIIPTFIAACLKMTNIDQWNDFLEHYNLKSNAVILFPLTNATSNDYESSTHWFLIVYSRADGICRYFDSDYKPENMITYGIEEFCTKIVEYLGAEKLCVTPVNCLKQANNCDCGIHVIMNVESIIAQFTSTNSCAQLPTFSTKDVVLKRSAIAEMIKADFKKFQVNSLPVPIASTSAQAASTSSHARIEERQRRSPRPRTFAAFLPPSLSSSSESDSDNGARQRFLHIRKSLENIMNEPSPCSYPAPKPPHSADPTFQLDTDDTDSSTSSMFEKKPPKKVNNKVATIQKVAPTTKKSVNTMRKKPTSVTTKWKRQKGVKPIDQKSKKNFTSVKKKLRTIVNLNYKKSDILLQLITKHVIAATKIAALASLLLLTKVNDYLLLDNHFFDYDAEAVVKDCFFEVLDPNISTQGKRYISPFPQFRSQRFANELIRAKIRRPNNCKMGNIYKYLYQQYASNFQTNVCTHGYKRIWNFFKTIPDTTRAAMRNTIHYLFNKKSKRKPNVVLLTSLRNLDARYQNWSVGCLADFNEEWFSYVPLFIHIQRHVYAYNMQNAAEWRDEDSKMKNQKKKKSFERKHPKVNPMNIVPLCKYRRQHIRIDTEGLYRLVAQLNELPKWKNRPNLNIDSREFSKRKDEFWPKYFNLEAINLTCDKSMNKIKFAEQIHTDGVSASTLYERSSQAEVDTEVNIRRIRKNYEEKKYVYRTSIDVGYNTYIAAKRQNIKTAKEVNTKIKSKAYHRSTKNNLRKKKFLRLVGHYERRTAAHRETFPVMPTPTGPDCWTYVNHRLDYFTEGITLYCQRSYASMAFNKYRNSQSKMDAIVTRLTNKQPTLFLIGGAEFHPSSPIKGHVRCPGIRKFTKALRKYRHSDKLFVDEYNTSQHCGICVTKFAKWTKNARYKRCTHCPAADAIVPPAPIIVSKTPKRIYQRQRQQGEVAVHSMRYIKAPDAPRHATNWQRDISACRLIDYKGINALLQLPIDDRLLRPNNNESDHTEDTHNTDVELLQLSTWTPTVIWY